MQKFKYQKAKEILWVALTRKTKNTAEAMRIEYVRHNHLFDRLELGEIRRLMEELYPRTYPKGEYIFQMGQPGAVLFIVTSGDVVVELPAEHEGLPSTELAVLGPGSFLGELALLDESPRSASARAQSDVEALALSRRDLESLSQREPVIGYKIYRALALIVGERLKSTNQLLTFEEAAKEKSA